VIINTTQGYALIEYAKAEEAEEAIKKLNGAEFMDKKINVDWAFSKAASKSYVGMPVMIL
jgi:RNA recognition motif-containing protein